VFICAIRGQTDLKLSLAGVISKFCLDRLTSFSQARRGEPACFWDRQRKFHPVEFFAGSRNRSPPDEFVRMGGQLEINPPGKRKNSLHENKN